MRGEREVKRSEARRGVPCDVVRSWFNGFCGTRVFLGDEGWDGEMVRRGEGVEGVCRGRGGVSFDDRRRGEVGCWACIRCKWSRGLHGQ